MSSSKIPFLLACFPPNTQMNKQFLYQSLQHFKKRIVNIEHENDWACRVIFESKSSMNLVQKETKGMIKLETGGFITLLTEDWFYSHIKHENRIRSSFYGHFSSLKHLSSPGSNFNPISESITPSTK
ncbi:unnamed protein product, partial [Mesorhabditis belari]|uniref:Uncharacterized protein n=1 Tax=Mesorhabditis belari TaxID=2138241 RepID=A0AAF3JAZ6_9BILA